MLSSIRAFLLFFAFTILFVPVKSQVVAEENRLCIECHTSQSFTIHNDWTGMDQTRLMNPFYIMDTIRFANGVHGAFQCIDCHSYEYETYPHNGDLKLEPLMTCIDCHGGDDTYASYQFDRVEEEFEKSIHRERLGDQFTCSKCHDQHYYTPTARTSSNVREIVEYSNNMCLSCHDNMIKYQLVSDKEKPQLVQIHEWLPNQELHFNRVRCIECHTDVQDSLMVSHNILPKEEATKNCVECHSSNSMLQASLYKYQNLMLRSGNAENDSTASGEVYSGSFQFLSMKNIFSNQYYVIGASRIPLLNTIFVAIFVLTLAGIFTHAIFRFLKK